jgi:hypothetical protein
MIPDGLFAGRLLCLFDYVLELRMEPSTAEAKTPVRVERSERSWCVGFFGVLHCVQDDSKDLYLALSCGSIEAGPTVLSKL